MQPFEDGNPFIYCCLVADDGSGINQSSGSKRIDEILVQDIVRNETASGFNRSSGIAVRERFQFGIKLIEATLDFLPVDDFLLFPFVSNIYYTADLLVKIRHSSLPIAIS